MTYKILWAPLRWVDDRHIELQSVGDQCEAIITDSLEEVTEAQWESCDAIVSLTDVPEPYRSLAARCRIFVTPKVGYDNIDLCGWGKRGIPVCNVPHYGTREVADHAIGLYLDLIRGITYHTRQLKNALIENWKPIAYKPSIRLAGTRFGIVGLGRIGMATALRAKAFEMDVCFYDPYVESGRDKALGLNRVDSMEALFAECDSVSLHLPLGEGTEKIINARLLSHCKPSLVLINTARGPLIDLDALYEALKSNTLFAAALDVLPQESPVDAQHPLLTAWCDDEDWIKDRLLLTPHSAFYSTESMFDMRYLGGETAAKYLTDGALSNCVNKKYLQ